MLEIKHLYKRYGRFLAVNDLNMNVAKGELFGFVGANGAGKTTTMRICVGLLSATSGNIRIDGEDVLDNHKLLSRKIGYVPDFFGVYNNFTAMEYLEFFAATYGIYGQEAEALCKDLLELVKLPHKANTDVNGLSRGMKQRMCLARALVHNPEILFLDEPASGLDPKARFELKEILKNLSSMGKTIIISSHILPELAEMCTSVGIIDKGHLVLQGSMEEIHRAAAISSPVIVAVEEDSIDHAFEYLKQLPKVKGLTSQGSRIQIVFDGNKEDEKELLHNMVTNDIGLYSFTRQEGSLESLFMQIVSAPGKAAAGSEGGV